MSLIKFGNDAQLTDCSVSGNTVVTHNPEKVTLVEFGDNTSAINSFFDENEAHTPESYAVKINALRCEIFNELEREISSLRSEITQVKLNIKLNELKALPATHNGQRHFKRGLNKFKDFAIDLGAKAVAEIAMKQMGY